MSSLYNNNYISSLREEYISNVFKEHEYVDLNPNNLDKKQLYVVLQHYLIKYIEENGKDNYTQKWLDKYYSDFIDYPYLFCDSPLLKDRFLERFVKTQYRNRIKEYRDKYYDKRVCEELYKKMLKKNLREDENNRLYSFLIFNMNHNNTRFDSIYEACFKHIENDNKRVRYLSEMEFKFYGSYLSKKESHGLISFQVHITDKKKDISTYQSKGLLFINKNNEKNVKEFKDDICEEVKNSIYKSGISSKKIKSIFSYTVDELLPISKEKNNKTKM